VSRFQSSHDFSAGIFANFGIEATLENLESSVAYGFEVPKRACHKNDRNFKSATIAVWFSYGGERQKKAACSPEAHWMRPVKVSGLVNL